MKQLILKDGSVTTVDDCDYEYLNQWKWHLKITPNSDLRYAVRNEVKQGKLVAILMHRMIMGTYEKCEIDHIDRNGLNNCKSNLRLCTHQQNMCNRKTQKHSCDSKGVSYRKNRYESGIKVNNKTIHLGTYKTEYEAAIAYAEAALKYHKEFARVT